MAVNQNDITSDAINAIPMPSSLPCKECARDKTPPSFSNRNKRDYQYMKYTNPAFVPTVRNSSYKCRKCTGEQVHELKCEGQCGLWKSLDAFSKNQRTKGDNWCKDCVSWKGSLEPGTIPQAAPNADLATDEDENVYGRIHDGFYDLEEGDGGGDDDGGASTPLWRGMETMSVADSTATAAGRPPRSDAASIAPSMDYVPPHLRGRQATSNIAATPSASSMVSNGDYVPPHLQGRQGRNTTIITATNSAEGSTTSAHEYVPPHLRGRQGPATASARLSVTASITGQSTLTTGYVPSHLGGMQTSASGTIRQSESFHSDDMASTSSISNLYEDAETGTSSSTVGRPVQFNAWGPAGQQQVQYRYPSGNTSVTAPAPLPRLAASAQASAPTFRPSTARNNGNWARTVGTRTAVPVYTRPYGPSAPLRRNRNGYDSDGSQDEM